MVHPFIKSSPRTRYIHSCCRAFDSGTVTICWNNLYACRFWDSNRDLPHAKQALKSTAPPTWPNGGSKRTKNVYDHIFSFDGDICRKKITELLRSFILIRLRCMMQKKKFSSYAFRFCTLPFLRHQTYMSFRLQISVSTVNDIWSLYDDWLMMSAQRATSILTFSLG